MKNRLLFFSEFIPNTIIRYLRKKPFSVSFDITNKCNIRCHYCYYYSASNPPELSDKEMLNLIKKVSDTRNYIHATFIGGEPTLRPSVLKEAVELFPQTWINTNGLNGFPYEIKPSAWLLSLDGPRKFHDSIKGKGSYEKAISSISDASSNIITNTTLYNSNIKYIENLVSDLSKTGIKGMIFSFYTTVRNKSVYSLTDIERANTIQRILKIRKDYPNFIYFTPKMAYYQNPFKGLRKWNSSEYCPVSKYGIAYGADGRIKSPCAMGSETICSRCGCGMNSIFLSTLSADINTLKFLTRML